jgi:light-regulated signal transduction histidine kinase (bacteriophytochrome)
MISTATVAEEFKQYAYSVSHDVSAPVRAMVEFSKLLSTEESAGLSTDGKEYLSFIVENGQKLQAMMDGLLEYSRLNTQASAPTKVDMNQLVRVTISELDGVIKRTGAVIEIGELPTLYADAEQLKRLFHALIDNALKFQRLGNVPIVNISAKQTSNGFEFAVADNGIGISSVHQQSIFQPFKRLHTDEEYPGVGMGLTLARKIAQRHGGTLTCSANTPNGVILTLTLPATEV